MNLVKLTVINIHINTPHIHRMDLIPKWTLSETPIQPTGWYKIIHREFDHSWLGHPTVDSLSPGKEYNSTMNLSQDGWVSGGFHIYTKETLFITTLASNFVLAEISIPEKYRNKVYKDGARTIVEGFKVERFCDLKDSELWNDPEYCKYMFEKNPDAVRYIPNATYDMWLNAVSRDAFILAYLPKDMFTLEICTAAMNNCVHAIYCVPEEFQTEELCLMAIRQKSCNVSFIKNMTDTLYLEMEKYKD